MPRRRSISFAEAFSDARSDYNAARNSRFRRRRTGVSTLGSGADHHYRSEADYLKMMELARDFDRNDVIVGQGVNRVVDNVIQDGIRLDAKTGEARWDDYCEQRWKKWGKDRRQCHSAGRLTWHQIERLALRHTIVDGDILGLPLEDGTLETVEAHRLRTPRSTKRPVIHGVHVDERGRPKEYWFTRQDLDPHRALARVADIKAYPAYDEDGHPQVFHVLNPTRVSQTRGVTAFAPIVDPIGMHDDIQFANLVRQQIAACVAIFRERDASFDGSMLPQYGDRREETLPGGATRTIENFGPGLEIAGAIGEKLTGFSPNIPNPQWFDQAHLILTFIAVNLGIPVAVLLLDPSQTNFSGWRGAIDQARIGFREIQTWLSSTLHGPVYEWKVRQWLSEDPEFRAAHESGQIDAFGHHWNPPTWTYIEPLKDISADVMEVKQAQNSPRRVQARRGRDWYEVAKETVEDNGFAIVEAKKAAAKINAAHDDGAPVHWRELISLPAPEGLTLNVGTSADAADADENTRRPQEAA